MGNKVLRPSQLEPLTGFNDDQISYLHDKFEMLCDENKLLNANKIAQCLQTTKQEAVKILNYIDFEGIGEVDFYEFTCAAASLHQNDNQARAFLYDIYHNNGQMDLDSFNFLFGTIFRYLKFLNLIDQNYSPELGEKKFKKYDFNKNGTIGFDEFESMLKSDYHCQLWMEHLGFAEPTPQQVKEKPINDQLQNEFKTQEAAGEQAGSTPSWIKTVQHMAPENFQPPKGIQTAPSDALDVNYVYGYRSYDTRDNLRYNSNGEIVYHTAALGIVLNKAKNTMRVNNTHNDDVTCLDSNIHKNLVATGQMGRKPSLVIWDSNTLQTKAIFKNNLEKSIATVAISKSGQYVAATSMNDNHEIAVYNLQGNSLVAYGRGPKSVIYSIKFNQAQDVVVCACAKEVVFAKFRDGKIDCKKGIFGKAPVNPNLCVVNLGDQMITSMNNGLLALWKGNSCSKVFKEHSKSVGAMCQRADGGIISGDCEGKIILWSMNMVKEKEISLEKSLGGIKSNNIRIIALSEFGGNIAVGTRGGEIIQISKNQTANVLMEGHYDQQLWGLSVAPNKGEFVTGGQDKLLMKWDMGKRKLIVKKKLESPINSVDISRQNVLAVGHRNGVVSFFDYNTFNNLKRISNIKNPDKDMLSLVKFSPDGGIIAVGYCPPISKVYLYSYESLKKIGQCKGSPSRILAIDFSYDGGSIMVNNTSYQILFYKTNNGSFVGSASSFRGQQWSTLTCRFSWQSQGIWPPCSDGSDINSVDRSNSKKYLATGDDFSKVKVFKYPVCVKRQIYNAYKGHSSHVTGVKWSYDDKFLISTGGLEKSIIQWIHEDQQQPNYTYEEEEEEKKSQKAGEDQEEYEFELEGQKKEENQQGEFGLDADEGDQALATKAFLGQVKASTPLGYKFNTKDNKQPDADMDIEHVWGVRNEYIGDRVRKQVKYSNDYQSCFFITAALGVEMNLKTSAQSFYRGHQEDLICFSISADGNYCATGQMAQLNLKKATQKIVDVHVWDAKTKRQLCKLGNFHKRAIVLVQFSPSGKKLLTVGQDDKNSLAVYDWQISRIAWSSPVCNAKVTGAAWKNETEYITVGLKHVKFWNMGKGSMGKLTSNKWDPMFSGIYWDGKFVSGGGSGNVYLWGGNVGNPTKGHDGRVDILSADKNGSLYSGCSKGILMKWKVSGGKLVADRKVMDASKIDKLDPGLLSIDFSKNKILLCTNSSSIYEVQINKTDSSQTLMQSHFKDELWAASWSPDCKHFVTGGDDKTVRIYDAITYKMLHCYQMKERVRGLDWDQKSGNLIIVGDYKGKIYLFDTELNLKSEMKTKFSKTKPRKQPFWIQDIKFSPNGEYVAFGAHGGASHLQIYKIEGEEIKGPPKILNGLITSALLSVDWSQSSDLLAIVSQAYELQFCSLDSKVSASSVRDVKWATWSGKFGFCVQEIFQNVEYSSINAVCMSPSRTLIVTGADDQKIRLFNYPVTIPKQKCKVYVGHSSHVTRVLFTRNQHYLLSEGGNDRTIILWKMKESQVEPQQQQNVQEKQEQVEEQPEQGEEGEEGEQEYIAVPKLKEQPKVEKKTASDDFQMDEDSGDQFTAVKSWLGAIKQPTVPYYKGTGKAPPVTITLQYAHGYRVKDCRNNLIYLSPSEICYHTAGVGVMMKIDETPKQQRFFNLHTDDIISMNWSEDKQTIFTGEIGAKPIIYAWDTNGVQKQLYKGVKKGVSAVAANQKYVVGAGLDDDHQVYLFHRGQGKLLHSQKGGKDVIISMKWVNENTFVSIGIKHYKEWTVTDNKLKGKSANFKGVCNILCSVVVGDKKIFVGAGNGELQLWSGSSCTGKPNKLHKGAINALCLHQNMLLTGSSDETIKIVEKDTLSVVNTIDCNKLLQSSISPSIRALDVQGNNILVGTLGSQIYQIKSNQAIKNSTQSGKFRMVGHYMDGHYAPNFVTNEVWGLNLIDEKTYATCSDDGTLRIWDINKKEQMGLASLKFGSNLKPLKIEPKPKFLPDSVKGRCIAISPEKDIVVGCKDGTLRILNCDLKPVYSKQLTKKQISHIKFSPDGSMLAIGAHDATIYFMEWQNGHPTLKFKCNKHSSYIKNFDFSRDGNFIHSTCGAYELLFFDTNTGKQVTSGATSTRDEEWATWNVTLGWPVQGIYEEFMDGTDVNAVDRSNQKYKNDMKLIASGDDRGKVRILEYPCLVKSSQSVVGRGHSSHVTNVKFTRDDKYVISTGGQDQTIFQWRINPN